MVRFDAQRLPPGPLYPERADLAAVWVDLAAVFVHPADTPHQVVPDGLDLTARVPGMLERDSWRRSGSDNPRGS